jgi:CBS domain-containing protein
MLLGTVATRRPVCIDHEATVADASRLMREQQVGELVVTERQDGVSVPAGILSSREIVTRVVAVELDASVMTVGDIMWSRRESARLTDSVPETLERLCAAEGDSLPVIDGNGRVTGVVSVEDLLQALAGEFAPPPPQSGPDRFRHR